MMLLKIVTVQFTLVLVILSFLLGYFKVLG